MAEFTTAEGKNFLQPPARTRCSRNAHKLLASRSMLRRQRFSVKAHNGRASSKDAPSQFATRPLPLDVPKFEVVNVAAPQQVSSTHCCRVCVSPTAPGVSLRLTWRLWPSLPIWATVSCWSPPRPPNRRGMKEPRRVIVCRGFDFLIPGNPLNPEWTPARFLSGGGAALSDKGARQSFLEQDNFLR